MPLYYTTRERPEWFTGTVGLVNGEWGCRCRICQPAQERMMREGYVVRAQSEEEAIGIANAIRAERAERQAQTAVEDREILAPNPFYVRPEQERLYVEFTAGEWTNGPTESPLTRRTLKKAVESMQKYKEKEEKAMAEESNEPGAGQVAEEPRKTLSLPRFDKIYRRTPNRADVARLKKIIQAVTDYKPTAWNTNALSDTFWIGRIETPHLILETAWEGAEPIASERNRNTGVLLGRAEALPREGGKVRWRLYFQSYTSRSESRLCQCCRQYFSTHPYYGSGTTLHQYCPSCLLTTKPCGCCKHLRPASGIKALYPGLKPAGSETAEPTCAYCVGSSATCLCCRRKVLNTTYVNAFGEGFIRITQQICLGCEAANKITCEQCGGGYVRPSRARARRLQQEQRIRKGAAFADRAGVNMDCPYCATRGAEGLKSHCSSLPVRIQVKDRIISSGSLFTFTGKKGIDDDTAAKIADFLRQDYADIPRVAFRTMLTGIPEGSRPARYIQNQLYKDYHIKLTPLQLERIGSMISQQAVTQHLYARITSRFNLPASTFYNEDSCWWQSWSYSRCFMKAHGGMAFLLYETREARQAWVNSGGLILGRSGNNEEDFIKKPNTANARLVGRSLILPLFRRDSLYKTANVRAWNLRANHIKKIKGTPLLDPPALLVFNAYGYSNLGFDRVEKHGKLLARITGWTPYTVVAITPNGRLYINRNREDKESDRDKGNATLLLPPETEFSERAGFSDLLLRIEVDAGHPDKMYCNCK